MAEASDYLDEAGAVAEALTDLGLEPVLVGGMALVVLGSQRVTRDFDFVVARPEDRLESLIGVFYRRGLELVSRLTDEGEVTATIDNRKVASIRLRLDSPASVYFFNRKTGLRIDLLFDFPVPAVELARNATAIRVRSYKFLVASEPDLLRLKKIAQAKRSWAGDAQDLAFLEARQRRS